VAWKVAVIACAVGLLVSLTLSCGRETRASPPKTLILVTIDTLRADHLPFAGYPRNVAPFLEQLAHESVVLTQAISASSHTGPSHASMLTSLYPSQHQLLENGAELDGSVVTAQEVLGEAGYRTAAFTPVGFLDGLRQGFEHFDSAGEYVPASGMVEIASAWLRSVSASDRVFVWLHLYDVHEWYQDHHVDGDAQSLLQQTAPATTELFEHLRVAHGLSLATYPLRRDLADVIDRYDGQLLAVDRALATFFAELKALGRYEDSVAIVTSDHGEGLGNHGYAGHGKYVYEEQLHVPLVVHAADGRWPVGRRDALVSLVDLAPSLIEIAGAPALQQVIPIEGRSLVPLLTRAEATGHAQVVAERRPADEMRLADGWAPGEVVAHRSLEEKVIVTSSTECELYMLGVDPLELYNQCVEVASSERERYVSAVLDALGRRQQAGERLINTGIRSEHIDELRALGYMED
jgi:arylsulfatase A-like enzyme